MSDHDDIRRLFKIFREKNSHTSFIYYCQELLEENVSIPEKFSITNPIMLISTPEEVIVADDLTMHSKLLLNYLLVFILLGSSHIIFFPSCRHF